MKYLVQKKVVGDINFEIEASDMVEAVKLARKYIEDNHKDIFIEIDRNNNFIYIDRDNIRNELYLIQLLESEEIKKSIYSYIDNISGY